MVNVGVQQSPRVARKRIVDLFALGGTSRCHAQWGLAPSRKQSRRTGQMAGPRHRELPKELSKGAVSSDL